MSTQRPTTTGVRTPNRSPATPPRQGLIFGDEELPELAVDPLVIAREAGLSKLQIQRAQAAAKKRFKKGIGRSPAEALMICLSAKIPERQLEAALTRALAAAGG
jgi:hypothetical protein